MSWWRRHDHDSEGIEPSRATAESHRERSRADLQWAELLRQCCAQRTPCVLLSFDPPTSCEARFASLSLDSVVVELLPGQPAQILPPLSVCIVSFSHGYRSCAFVSAVLSFEPHRESPDRLVVAYPTQVAVDENHKAIRIPVPSSVGLEVTIADSRGRAVRVEPLNLGPAGILLECQTHDDPELSVESGVTVRLQLGEEAAELAGIVCKRDRGRYGLFFPDVIRDGELDLPVSFLKVFKAVEREWLRHRVEEIVPA